MNRPYVSFICQHMSILALSGVCTVSGRHQSPVTCQERFTQRKDIHKMHLGASIWVCGCVCAFRVRRQYLLEQTSSGSSVNSMASHHAETQPAGHIYCTILLIHSITFLLFSSYISSFIVLIYLSMLSSCELSVALITLQTQRVVVPP